LRRGRRPRFYLDGHGCWQRWCGCHAAVLLGSAVVGCAAGACSADPSVR
jgi:hypothetical protein